MSADKNPPTADYTPLSFNATIEYGKLAITLVASLGVSVGLALLTFVGTRPDAGIEVLKVSPCSLRLTAYCLIASAALPPLSAAFAYVSQGFFTDEDKRSQSWGRWLRFASAVVWLVALLALVVGSVRALHVVVPG